MNGKFGLVPLLLLVLVLSSCRYLPQPTPLWLVDGFDFPVGDRNGKGWAVTGYQFLDWSTASQSWHPGEDWNIPGAGNADQGEPVYAVANGEVVFSGWNTALGNVILIKHNLTEHDSVWSQYAHLDQRRVATGDIVHRREIIGTVGRGPNNRFSAHLHFEIRQEDMPANAWPRTNGQAWTKEKVRDFWLHPTRFIRENRPQ
ncbi:MAG: M23 family metallopeptidase [Firmicutes bacterium]|nr:M23 family metallopeptidase [Bacillota bacterium]